MTTLLARHPHRDHQNLIVAKSSRRSERAAFNLAPAQRIGGRLEERCGFGVVARSIGVVDRAEGLARHPHAFLRRVFTDCRFLCRRFLFWRAGAGSSPGPSYAARRWRAARSAMRWRNSRLFMVRFCHRSNRIAECGVFWQPRQARVSEELRVLLRRKARTSCSSSSVLGRGPMTQPVASGSAGDGDTSSAPCFGKGFGGSPGFGASGPRLLRNA